MTPAELAAVKNDMLTFDTAAMARLLVQETKRSAVFSKTWEVAVQDAIQFYEAALKREIAAETQLNLFLNQSSEKIAVLVYGGFHRQGIENVLARKGFSYYVISPKISNIEIRDQTRYRKLMAEGYEIDPLHAERVKEKEEREMTKTEKLENVQAARVISELELVHRGGATALRSLQRYHLNLNGIASQVLERTAESVQPREYVSAQIDRRLREQLIGVRSEVRNTAEDRQKFIELLHLLNRNWWLINDGQALDKFFLEFQEHHPNEDAVRGWDDEKFLDRKRGAAEMISHRLAAGKLRAMVLSYPEDEAHLFQLLAQLKMPLRTDDFDLWQNTQDVEVQRLRRALDPAQHLARQGYEVHIVTSHDPTLNHSNTFIYEEAAAAAKHLMRWMTRHPSDLEVEQKTYLFSEMTDPLYELVFNLIEYGESGVLGFKRTRSEEGDFFEAVVWDNGPGLLDPQTALTASLGRLGANGAGFRQLNYFPGTVTIESHDKKWVKQGSEPLFIPAGPGSVKSGSGTKITLRIGINLEGARYAHAEAREAGLVESGVRQSGKRSEVRASSSSQFRVYLIDYILSDIDHKKTANKIINLFLSSSTSLRDEIKDRLQNLLNNQKEGAALRDLGLGALLQQTSAGQRARIRVLYERLFDSTGAAHKQIPLLDESKSSLPQTTKASVSAESNVLIIKMGKRKERLALETLQQPLKQEDEARLRAIYTPYNAAVALEQMRNGQFSWNDSIFQVVRNEQGVLIAYGWAYLNPKTKVLGLASVGVDKAYRKKGIAAWLRIGQMDQGVSRGMTSVRAHVGTEGRRNGWHWSLKKLGFDFESFSFSDMDVMFQNAADQALRDVKTQTTGLNEEQQKEAVEKVLNRFPAASLVMGMRLTYGSVARFKEVVRNRTKRSEVRTSFDESKRGQVFVLLIGTRTAMQPFKDYLIAQGYHPENVDIVSPRSKKELPRPEKIYHAKVKLGELPDTAFETLLKSLEFNLPWTYREFVSRGSDAETYWNKKDLLERQRQALNAREQQLRERALEIERELPLRQAAVARAKAHADKVRVWANKVRERIHNSVFWLIFYTIALALKDKGAFRISAASIITFYGLIVSVKLFFHFWGHPYGLIWSALATAVVAGVFGDFAYTVLSGFTKSRNEEAEDAAKENSEKNKSDFLGYLVQYGGAALFAPPFILAANFFWGSGIWANVKLGAGTFFSYRLHWILGALLAVDLIIHLFKRHNNEHDSSDSETRLLNAATATLVAPVGEEFWFRWAWFNLSQWWWVGWVVFSHPFNFQLPFIGVSVGFGLPLGVFIAMMANADLFFKAHGTRKWFHHWFMGAVASYVYYESHSLIVPITIHFLWNLTSSIYQLALHRYLPLRPSSLDFETLEALTSRPVGESSDQPRSEVRSLRKENLEAPGPRNRDAFVEQEEQYQRLEQKLKRTIRWRDYSLNGAIGAVTLAVGLVLLECWPEATAGFAIAGVLMSAAVLALNVRIEQIGDEQELLRRSVFERRARYFDLLRHELDARWLDLRSSLNRIWTQDEIPHIYLHDLLSYLEKLKQADEQAFDGANPIREFLTDYRDWRRRLEREAGDAFMKTLNAVEGFIRHEVIVEIPEVNLGVVLALKKHLFKTAALLKKQVGRSEVRVSYQELLQSRKKKLTVAEEGVFFQALHDAVVSESEKQVIRNYLIELYLPSVRHTAVKMGFKGEAFLSAVQDGVIGLLDAINRFDYNSGIHFYSYAGIRVRGNILDENLEDASTPKKTRRRIYRYGLVRLALERQLGREVSAEEWARELGISEIELMNSLSLKYTRSLDEPLRAAGAGSEETMGQQLSYGEADPLLSDVNDFEVLLGRVTILEQLIIKLRYGIGTKNSESYTLENVGRMLGMSSYLVSRNEKEAMEILQEEISLDSKNSVSKDNADVFIVEQMGIKPNDDAFNRLYALKRTQLEQFSAGDIAIRIHEKETIFSIPKIINHPEVLALGPDLVAQRIVALLHGKEIEWRRTQVAHISFQEQAIQDYPEYLQYEPGEALDRQAEIMRFLDIDYSPQIEVRLSETAKFVYLLKQPLKSFSKEEFSEEVWWTLSPLERRAYELVVGETKSLIQAESQLRQEGFLSLTKPAQFGRTKGIGLVVILAKNKLASGKTGMTRLAEVAGAKRENLTEDLLNYLDRRYWRALQLTYGINGPKAQNAKAIVRIMRANGIRKLGARTSVEDAKSIVSTSNRVGLRLLRKNQTGWDYLSRDSGVPVQRLKDPDFKNSIPEEDWRVLQYAYGLGVRRVMHASERLTVLNSLGMTFRNTRHLSDVQAKTIMNMRDLKTGRERIAEKMGVEPSWITDDEFAQLRPKQKLVLGMHYGIGRHRVKQGKALRERLASEGGLDRNGKDYSVAAIGTLKARAFERLRRILLGEDVTAEDLKKMIAASERRRVVEGIPAGVPFTSQDFEQLIIALKPLSDEKSVSDRIRLLRDIWFGLTPFERAVTEINFGLGQAAENHFQKISDAVAKNSLVWDKKTPPSISFISSSRANAILALEQGKTGWKVFSEDSGIPEDFLRTSLDQVLNERENVAFRLKYGLGQPRLRDDVQIQAVMKIKQQQISDARRYGLRKLQKAYVASGAVLRPNPTKREQKFQGGAGWTEAAMREVIAERTDLDLVSKHMIRDGYAGMLKKAASIYGSWDQTLVHFGRDPQKIREAFKQTKKRSEVRAHFGLTEEEVQRLLPTYPTAEAFFGQIDAWEKANPDSKILTLVRHGESMSNLFHYSQSYDSFSPLTSRGQKQAQALAAFFKHMQIRFGQYVASSLERALDTLAPAASQNGSKARKLQRFREILLNPVGEIPMDVLSEIAPDLWSRFTENPELFYLPGGQYSGQKFKEYLYKFIGEDFVKNEGRRTLVASHGMTILLTLMYLLNIPREKYNDFWPKVGTPTHAGITVLAYHPGRENPWEFLVKSDDTHMPEDLRGKTRDKGAVFFERIRFYVLALGRLLQNLLVSPKDVPDDYFSKWRTFFSMNKRQATQSLADYWKRSSGVVGLLDLDWRVDDEARKIDAAQYPEVRVMYESKPGQVQEVGRAPAGPVYGLGREVRQRIRELEKPATDQLAAQLVFSVEHRDGV
ncbi:MAG: sigma-70 family RNA polymerase sigma factor, partial [Candidatus Omnitrophica bacterium]|nr:sigma-70 family RNA polymerase sigma factor [Candidatus Omnitrophota bacterium]